MQEEGVHRGHDHDHCAVDWNLARLAAKSSSWAARSSSSVMQEFSNLDTFFSRSWKALDVRTGHIMNGRFRTFCCCL